MSFRSSMIHLSQHSLPVRPTKLFQRSYILNVQCEVDAATNRIKGKLENSGPDRNGYAYRHDGSGHLTHVWRDGALNEEYSYNRQGQRARQVSRSAGFNRQYVYGREGRLVRTGHLEFTYDDKGALASRTERRYNRTPRTTRYFYNGDTLLDKVILPERLHLQRRPMLFKPGIEDPWGLPGGGTIKYVYGGKGSPNPVGPVQKYRENNLIVEYTWQDMFRLKRCTDYELGVDYQFSYGPDGRLSRVFLTGIPQHKAGPLLDPLKLPRSIFWNEGYDEEPEPFDTGLELLCGRGTKYLTLHCGCDQVGTPKLFTLDNGALVRKVTYDSFGVPIRDSRPELFIPIGFANGLLDRDTGLVRFGYRDYDPEIGRFLCPDPARDMRGDGDLYNYCADDPVSMVDPNGLWAKATFDESKVSRDDAGRFGSGGGAAELAVRPWIR